MLCVTGCVVILYALQEIILYLNTEKTLIGLLINDIIESCCTALILDLTVMKAFNITYCLCVTLNNMYSIQIFIYRAKCLPNEIS